MFSFSKKIIAAAAVTLIYLDTTNAIEIGDQFCIEGFAVNFFCIEQGTFLDASDVFALENPELHSIHCLIDVPSSVESPFEVLVPNPEEGGTAYVRGWRLDDASKAEVIKLAREVGICNTCNGEGNIERGLRVVFEATVVESAYGGVPVIVSTKNLRITFEQEGTACQGSSGGPLEVGDNICVEGFAVDQFCIDGGTFLDAPDVFALENPELHSIHCLVDIPICANSPFEILVPNPQSPPAFSRGWLLDDASHDQVVELARQVGICGSCDGSIGTVERGLRIAADATVILLATESQPVMVSFNDLILAVDDHNTCKLLGFGPASPLPPPIVMVSSRSNLMTFFCIHGALMLVGWGWLLPSGVIIAKLFRHCPNGLWFKIHHVVQPLGLVFALVGWIIALTQFTTLKDVRTITYRHAVMGMIAMCLGLFNPLNAWLRPHASEEGEGKTPLRLGWEIVHKVSGYGSIILAIPTISLGTTFLPPSVAQVYQIAYGVGCGLFLLILIIVALWDGSTYVIEKGKVARTPEQTEEGEVDGRPEQVVSAAYEK